jgi:hypothetical protein
MATILTLFISKQSFSIVKSVLISLLAMSFVIGKSESKKEKFPSFQAGRRDYEYNCLCPGVWRPVCTYGAAGTLVNFDNVCVATCHARGRGMYVSRIRVFILHTY